MELARYQDPTTKEWWRLVRVSSGELEIGVRVSEIINRWMKTPCALESISERSLERGLVWAHACVITVPLNEHVSPERVKAEMEAYLALGPRRRLLKAPVSR